MYVQITTKCNMTCDHCCYSCEPGKGEHMTPATYKAALGLVAEYGGESISIGGGEPTLHPDFWSFLGQALGACEYVWMATNGSVTDTALALAKMAKRGVIGCALSQDDFHDYIEDEVVQAFTHNKRTSYGAYSSDNNHDSREIRNVSDAVIKQGRAAETEVYSSDRENDCACPGVLVEPDGTVKACACPDSPTFGNVNTSIDIPEEWSTCDCWKDQEEY